MRRYWRVIYHDQGIRRQTTHVTGQEAGDGISGASPRAMGRRRLGQKASSGRSIRSRVVASAISRSADSLGSTVAAKKRAAAIFPS
jgi:hypothetical protein